MKSVCRRIDQTVSSVVHKSGNERPKTARTASNIVEVSEMLCSQKDQPGTSRSTRQIASELGISERSVRRIADDKNVYLNPPVNNQNDRAWAS